jgi:osmotically-inducible protein OsmY
MKTDYELQQDVINELKWEPSINAAHIGVEAKDGVVTLSGHVDTFTEKWNAERAAKRVSGVKVLAIDIEVKLSSSTNPDDTEVAKAIRHALAWSSYRFPESVRAEVDGGFVTLSGEVEWQYLKEAAANAVRFLKGVTGVINLITIKPKVSLQSVKADIEAALKRRAQLAAQKIQVQVNNDEVILSGRVHSWDEKNSATSAAWAVPGVHKVTDKLSVTI